MPDDEHKSSTDAEPAGVFSTFGIVSAVLGAVAVVAVVLAAVIFVGHRNETDELRYRTQVLQAAAEWTSVLINMNADTVQADMAKLQDGTVGRLNADFEASVEPYRRLVQTLKSTTRGQIDSVAIESIHHDDPADPADPAGPADGSDTAADPGGLSGLATRTDTVMVVATSVSENAGTEEPQTVRWTLRLGVSDVDGELRISRLEPIR